MKSSERIFGLDILRTVAILIVVLDHGKSLLKNYFAEFSNLVLPDGVNIFFVLSGYLIGHILIKTIEQNKSLNFTLVLDFLKRRWLRTLPNYFLFLIINIIIYNQFVNRNIVTYLFFFQNFHLHFDGIFWKSWSLSIEEWFYLLFPFILLFVIKIGKQRLPNKTSILIVIFTFLSLPLLYRIYKSDPNLDTSRWFRTLVSTRLDTIGYGLLGAYISYYYKYYWNKTKNHFFVLGVIVQFVFWACPFKSVFFNQTLHFSIAGLSVLFLLPKLVNIKTESIPFKPFQLLSKISYSIYLFHLPMLYFISTYFKASNKYEGVLVYFFFWVLTIGGSSIIYSLFERPIMDLGKKRKNDSFNRKGLTS